MIRQAAFRGAALALAASMLSGCVAAVIPLAAGAGIARSAAKGGENAPQAVASQRSDPATSEGGNPQLANPTTQGPAQTDAVDGGRNASPRLVSTQGMPPPSGRSDNAARATLDKFFGYALNQALRSKARDSALLASPGLLQPKRADCSYRPAAVMIDIDPGRGTFDPLEAARADPRLGQVLAALRAKDIKVFWITRLGEGFGEELRAVLAQTALDRRGEDELLLLSSLDERKQTRRNDVARSFCVVALLGDERADFDELYLYLKDPEKAIALDAMLGAGWFLLDPVIAGEPNETNGD